MITPDYDKIPQRLQRLVLSSPVRIKRRQGKAGAAGKTDKIPFNPATGRGISTKRPQEWLSFAEARALLDAKTPIIGALVRPGMVCIDLDNVVVSGKLTEWAEDLVQRMDSWTEVSPSGTGLHIWGTCDTTADGKEPIAGFDFTGALREDGSRLEVYLGTTPRHLTLTGAEVLSRPLRHFSATEVDDLCRHNAVRRSEREVRADVPELIESDDLPMLETMSHNNEAHQLFVGYEVPSADVSGFLVKVCKSLHANRVSMAEMLSILWHDPLVAEWLETKRPGGVDAQLTYLWDHQVLPAFEFNRPVPSASAPELFEVMGDPEELEWADEGPVEVLDDAGRLTDAALADGAALGFDDLGDDEAEPAVVPKVAEAKGYLTMAEILAEARAPITDTWIIQDVLPSSSLTLLGGPPAAGKSFVALDMALCVAAGKRWGQRLDGREGIAGVLAGQPVRQGTAVYVLAEAPATLAPRVGAWMRQHSLDKDDIPFVAITTKTPGAKAPSLKDDAYLEWLYAKLKEVVSTQGRLSLVVVDTFAAAAGGIDENAAMEVAPLMTKLERMATKLGTSVLVVAHSGKDKAKGMRGSSAFNGGAEQTLILHSNKPDDGKRTWELELFKSRSGPHEGKMVKMHLEQVPTGRLGNDEDLTPETTLVVMPVPPEKAMGQDDLGGDDPAEESTERAALALSQALPTSEDDMADLVVDTLRGMVALPGWSKEGRIQAAGGWVPCQLVEKGELVGATLQRIPPWHGLFNEAADVSGQIQALVDIGLLSKGRQGGYGLA